MNVTSSAQWTLLSAAKLFHQELKVYAWKNMGYFFTEVKEPFQFLWNKGKEGKIKKGLFLFCFLINKEVLISLGS